MTSSADNTTTSASNENLTTDKPPHVLIVGAGLAGLFLGLLLEKAGIPYDIYERASEIKPLGAVMSLSGGVMPAFEQLGIYDELMSFSKPSRSATFYTDKMKIVGSSTSISADIIGYDRILFARPELYDLMIKKTPPHKFHMCKKLVSFDQDHTGVKVHFEDGTIAEGDVLVGADGAHSGVRKHLYKTLEDQGVLPKSDTNEMNKGYISLLGTTDTLDPAKYPGLDNPEAQTSFVVGDGKTPYTWVLFTVPGNKICWNIVVQLGISDVADEHAGSSDWVPQQNQKMLDLIRHFMTPYGTLGDLFDATPLERVSKVYFEDMLFETWTHGRTVLIGDAAHKLLPSTGAGAVNAMQDAILLANCLYDIKPTSLDNIKTVLKDYKDQRYDVVKEQYALSHYTARIQFGHTLSERILRYVIFNWLPSYMFGKQVIVESAYRPQAVFLPLAPKRGSTDVHPQKPSRRLQKEEETKKQAATYEANEDPKFRHRIESLVRHLVRMSETVTDKDTTPRPSTAFRGSDLPPLVSDKPPHVLIAGAGLAGLFLGILLEKAGIPYDIFERSAEIKPLGAIMSLSPNILPAFEQLHLLDELMSFSKRGRVGTFYTDQMKVISTYAGLPADMVGYDRILFARPELYDMLFKKIPAEKMHMSKKILSFQQNHEGVMLRFSDNTTTHGDILVGADGAHSAVRQHLYKTLDKEGLLPKSDTKAMSRGYVSLIGTTEALDPANYPSVLEEECDSAFIIGGGDTPYTWATFTVPGNRICWNVIIQIGITEIADEQFKSSDWVPQQNQKMMDSIRHFKTTYGTLGDLFDATDIERVSKVYFEDMLFETWTHGRTVLIGDAAQKLLPSTGAGAVNAMQDAVLLANHLYDIKPTSFENIKTALKEYKEERFDAIKDQYPQSYISAKLMYGHTFTERILRQVVFNWLPKSIQHKQLSKDTAYRPQANFLPQAPKRGTIEAIPQRPSRRIQEEEEAAKKLAASVL
ncbi:hypothetical protein BGX33_009154 [Mortierella sp. NVP41]|nr:hypothetical protein BGX33_009154 [Mortierella sp. NVP41]